MNKEVVFSLFLLLALIINERCVSSASVKALLTPTPKDGATWVYREGTLHWSSSSTDDESSTTITYQVYLGTDSILVDAGDATVYQGSTTETQFQLAEATTPLTTNQCYFWRVDVINIDEVTKGLVWKFFVPGLLNPLPNGIDPAIGGRLGFIDRCNDSMIETGDDVVIATTRESFFRALENRIARIIIPDYDENNIPVLIDLTGYTDITIPAGVVLCGQRGKPLIKPQNSSSLNTSTLPGALLFTSQTTAGILFSVLEPGVRISGLRIQGPYEKNNVRGIAIRGNTLETEIDNCEISFFGYSNVYVDRSNEESGISIHHNFIHLETNNGITSYGVEVRHGFVDIYANIFDGGRHPISGHGGNGCSYEARYNIFLTGEDNLHQVDMHGKIYFWLLFWTRAVWCWQWCFKIIPCFFCRAGDTIRIHHNTFAWPSQKERGEVHNAIRIRGKPTGEAIISDNWFLHDNINDAVRQSYVNGNVVVEQNMVQFEITENCALDPEIQGSWTNYYRWFS